MEQSDRSEKTWQEASTKPAFGILCLVFLLTSANLAAKPSAIAMGIICLLSGIALAYPSRQGDSCGGETRKPGRVPESEKIVCFGAGQRQIPKGFRVGTDDMEAVLAAPGHKPFKFSHRVWTRSDGFTLSGVRRT